jgi:hypothetical protein
MKTYKEKTLVQDHVEKGYDKVAVRLTIEPYKPYKIKEIID